MILTRQQNKFTPLNKQTKNALGKIHTPAQGFFKFFFNTFHSFSLFVFLFFNLVAQVLWWTSNQCLPSWSASTCRFVRLIRERNDFSSRPFYLERAKKNISRLYAQHLQSSAPDETFIPLRMKFPLLFISPISLPISQLTVSFLAKLSKRKCSVSLTNWSSVNVLPRNLAIFWISPRRSCTRQHTLKHVRFKTLKTKHKNFKQFLFTFLRSS